MDLSEKINLDGGIGIGRVTKPGLEQKIGQAAINKVPRSGNGDISGLTDDRGGNEGDRDTGSADSRY